MDKIHKSRAKEILLCPFDDLPCEYVNSCDDALSLRLGFDMVEGDSCSRAVWKVSKK
jgi:hypothetical protein